MRKFTSSFTERNVKPNAVVGQSVIEEAAQQAQTPRSNIDSGNTKGSDNAEKIILGAAFTALLVTCAYMVYSARSERKLFEQQLALR